MTCDDVARPRASATQRPVDEWMIDQCSDAELIQVPRQCTVSCLTMPYRRHGWRHAYRKLRGPTNARTGTPSSPPRRAARPPRTHPSPFCPLLDSFLTDPKWAPAPRYDGPAGRNWLPRNTNPTCVQYGALSRTHVCRFVWRQRPFLLCPISLVAATANVPSTLRMFRPPATDLFFSTRARTPPLRRVPCPRFPADRPCHLNN